MKGCEYLEVGEVTGNHFRWHLLWWLKTIVYYLSWSCVLTGSAEWFLLGVSLVNTV